MATAAASAEPVEEAPTAEAGVVGGSERDEEPHQPAKPLRIVRVKRKRTVEAADDLGEQSPSPKSCSAGLLHLLVLLCTASGCCPDLSSLPHLLSALPFACQ